MARWCLAITAITSLPFMRDAVGAERWQRGQRMGYFSLLLVAGHLLVMGLSGWLKPAGWPGMLPPITMVAMIVAIGPLLTKILWSATNKQSALGRVALYGE